jgi:hypothetical protein
VGLARRPPRLPAPLRARGRRDPVIGVGQHRHAICGANVGASKTAKASKLGVEIVDQDEIWRRLVAAGVA